MFIPCPYCEGEGCFASDEVYCPECGASGWIEDNNEVAEMEITLEHPIPCKVDGKPAFILGYGCEGGELVIEYKFVGRDTVFWMYANGRRITDLLEQHDWHVDYHYRNREVV